MRSLFMVRISNQILCGRSNHLFFAAQAHDQVPIVLPPGQGNWRREDMQASQHGAPNSESNLQRHCLPANHNRLMVSQVDQFLEKHWDNYISFHLEARDVGDAAFQKAYESIMQEVKQTKLHFPDNSILKTPSSTPMTPLVKLAKVDIETLKKLKTVDDFKVCCPYSPIAHIPILIKPFLSAESRHGYDSCGKEHVPTYRRE